MEKIFRHIRGEKGPIILASLLLIFACILFLLINFGPLSIHSESHDICKKIEELKETEDDIRYREQLETILVGRLFRFQSKNFFHELFRHLSIALFIGGILIATVEWHSKARFQREAAEDVLFAVLKKQIPEPVFLEVQEHILRQPIYRKNWHYHFEFKGQPYQDLEKDKVVYENTVAWTVKNISSEVVKYTPCSAFYNLPKLIVHDEKGTEIKLGRHKGIWKNDKSNPLLTEKEIFEQEEKQRNNDIISLDIKPIFIDPNEEVTIITSKEEVTKNQGIGVWSMIGYGENLRVTIQNNAPDLIENINVDFLHPRKESLKKNEVCSEWIYKGGLLPFQGIRLSWSPKLSAVKTIV